MSMPGESVIASFSGKSNLDPAVLAELQEKAGFNDPWYVQYANWIKGLLQGDLGISHIHKVEITKLLGDALLYDLVKSCYADFNGI